MTKAQQAMIDDGLPAAFIMTTKERHALWETNPPRNTQTFLDPRIKQDRRLREIIKKEQAQRSKDLRNSHDPSTNPTHTQENEMAKYTIKPLDKHGHPVMRAITSIDDNSTDDQIEAKIVAAAERGGSKVVNVLLVNTLRQVVLAWEIKEGIAGPCDAGPFQPVEITTEPAIEVQSAVLTEEQPPTDSESVAVEEPSTETKESEVSKKVKNVKKVKKIKAPHKAKIVGEFKKGSKMEIVKNLFTRKSGVTTEEMLKATGWKAVGMMQQAKACGLKIKKEKTDKGNRYYAV